MSAAVRDDYLHMQLRRTSCSISNSVAFQSRVINAECGHMWLVFGRVVITAVAPVDMWPLPIKTGVHHNSVPSCS